METKQGVAIVNAINDGNTDQADSLLKDAMLAKVKETLQAKKVELAGQIFNK